MVDLISEREKEAETQTDTDTDTDIDTDRNRDRHICVCVFWFSAQRGMILDDFRLRRISTSISKPFTPYSTFTP